MSVYNCSFVRTCLEYALQGAYSSLAGLVSMNSCDHVRRLYDVWQERISLPYMYFLSVPHKLGDGATAWFHQELTRFRHSLEREAGSPVPPERLQEAIRIYNRTRELLRQLYELRKQDFPPLSGTEMHRIILAATATDREEYNRLLSRLLEEVQGQQIPREYRARLLIVGSVYDDPDFTQVLEEVGGLVVADALCFGSRYFWEPVAEEGDLLYNLAAAYLKRPACARMAGSGPQRLEFIKSLFREFKVDGVVFEVMHNCDLWAGETYYLERGLQEEGIPSLRLHREYSLAGIAAIRTRVEAFIEMIRG
jgi:benzoyl-CoA reductase/2-hydroxyglutaryl-CoA dehydratase subunit BcrC/BadD/HgdB